MWSLYYQLTSVLEKRTNDGSGVARARDRSDPHPYLGSVGPASGISPSPVAMMPRRQSFSEEVKTTLFP